jgi:hypothetical protein
MRDLDSVKGLERKTKVRRSEEFENIRAILNIILVSTSPRLGSRLDVSSVQTLQSMYATVSPMHLKCKITHCENFRPICEKGPMMKGNLMQPDISFFSEI